jgi:stearoyl-CoA desaturase (delta-9 desaturase)
VLANTSLDHDDASGHAHEVPMRPASALSQFSSLVAVIVPFVALITATIVFWDHRFSWLNLGLLLGGYLLTGLGVTIGYHRLFTHKSFKTNRVMTAIWGILGSMAIEGPILHWVSIHRRHHQHTDTPGDPHSPHDHGSGMIAWFKGMYHSHIGWFFEPLPTRDQMDRYVPDLIADPLVRKLDKTFGLWVLLGLLIPGLIGFAATQTWLGALTGFIWGGLVRVFMVHHITWSVNSVCHIWGRQPFNTHDYSRNNLIFGVLALGEGWHNNHHAFPASARHGLEWWQFDISYWLIRGMALVGLASDVRLPSAERVAAKRSR